jgi:hypothetical protein
LHGHTFIAKFIEPQYHKFMATALPYRRYRLQFGGASPVNAIGVAPVTVPMVALSLT